MSNPEGQRHRDDLTVTTAEDASSNLYQQHTRSSANGSGPLTTKPYPPPTSSYEQVVQNPNLFSEKLQSFHDSFGSKFKVPTIGGKALDLQRLFVEVTSRGGYEKVIGDRRWKEVVVVFKFPNTITSASFILRKYYLSLLYHFEQVYYFQKQGPPFSKLDPVSSNLVNESAIIMQDAAMNDLQVSPEQQLGPLAPGTIDGKFDGGYIVTVNLGSDQLNGVLYYVPVNVSRSSSTSGMPASQNRKRSKLSIRDPSRPKSNRSGYNFFFAEHYTRLKPLYYGQERAISKKIGSLWSNLTEVERQVLVHAILECLFKIYQDKGLRDKERYKNEMLEYKSSHN